MTKIKQAEQLVDKLLSELAPPNQKQANLRRLQMFKKAAMKKKKVRFAKRRGDLSVTGIRG